MTAKCAPTKPNWLLIPWTDDMISIAQFLLKPARNGSWNLFSPAGATRITNTNLAKALQELATAGSRISSDAATNIFQINDLPAETAIEFLITIRIFRKVREDKNITIYSPSMDIARSLASNIETTEGLACKIATKIEEVGPSNFLIAVQDHYSPPSAREIYSICRKHDNCILLHSYFVFRHFVIDGFYSSAMGLPDHFSGLYNIAGLERGIDFKPASWADFFLTDYLAVEEMEIPTFEPSEIERAAALHLVFTRFRPLLNNGLSLYASDLSTVTELNLDTGRVDRHRGVHSSYSDEPRNVK